MGFVHGRLLEGGRCGLWCSVCLSCHQWGPPAWHYKVVKGTWHKAGTYGDLLLGHVGLACSAELQQFTARLRTCFLWLLFSGC